MVNKTGCEDYSRYRIARRLQGLKHSGDTQYCEELSRYRIVGYYGS